MQRRSHKNKVYSAELKIQAVEKYLSGKGSQREVCKKYGILAKRTLEVWIKKLYLSAILDLYDRRIIAYKIGDSNNNELVFTTFDEATSLYPNAKPIFHSDRGFQYTNKIFHQKLVDAGMIQSMSRVGRCLDNASMEGWWGILRNH